MCGIAGFTIPGTRHVDASLIRAILHRLEHRGPDDLGYLVFSQDGVRLGREWPEQELRANVVLLNRRLSILDLSETGWQPMGTPDGRYYIVFNGEIYNYLELRHELETLGHRFRSQSDTEVLLTAYARWGPKALTRLVGMFALAILDTRERKLFLARDPFGIKPLYYTQWREGLAFASEIKVLFELPDVSRQVNPQRLYDYLRFGITDHGEGTLFAEIYQLPAAHFLELSLDRADSCRPVRYWQLDLGRRLELSFRQAAEQLRELFLESIRLHLRSDVPVGALLSGGIDSSSIVMAMRYLQGKDLELHTFSYIPDDAVISEEAWVDMVGAASGVAVHKIRPRAEELVPDIQQLTYVQDEPFSSTSIYAGYRVFSLPWEVGVKVMLDGQGGDELLGGYSFYAAARFASLVRQRRWPEAFTFLHRASRFPGRERLWMQAGNFLLSPALQAPLRRLVGRGLAPAWLNTSWFRERGVVPQPVRRPQDRELLRQEIYESLVETSLPMLLRYEDRNSMAYSIESRVPFLTPVLAEFLLALPEEYLISADGTSKAVFRQAMRGIVPDAVLDRRDKIAFETPERRWLYTLHPWVEGMLREAGEIPALNSKVVQQEWESERHGRRRFDYQVWRWVNLVAWARRFEVRFE